ncbi:RDD family protein [Corticimicrobacter populi]|uniref:RDD family protein n=1 Tax=Corticimicrobacter populi TaxID=2175229 RepID=A0A2V1JZG7_9BURK|nr:RDD family protein [Corticimicrobacter populi]PWF22689.1 RDD family protein [Corticimicrobacter populi]
MTQSTFSPSPSMIKTPGRWPRFASMMYEGILLFGLVFLADFIFDTLTRSDHALLLRHTRQAWLFVVLGAYFLLCWRRGGQTLPMSTWHIKLVDEHGLRPSLSRLALRYLLLWPLPLAAGALVWLIGRWTGWSSSGLLIVFAPFTIFIWTWLDRDGQFLHDRLAGTRLTLLPPRQRKPHPIV